MDNFYQLSVDHPSRYYVKQNEYSDVIKLDFDMSLYKYAQHRLLINTNLYYKENDFHKEKNHFQNLYQDYLNS